MNSNYNNILKNTVLSNYQEFLIIDIIEDKIYKYICNDGQFVCINESSYATYFEDCKKFIFEEDIPNYIDSLSISKLEESNNKTMVNYRMLDNKIGGYMNYTNYISLYNENGKRIIIVLVSPNISTQQVTKQTRVNNDDKMNKLVDAVSMSMLKIHNVVNMDNNLRKKDEYINSILVGLTTDFPILNKSFNDNAKEVYSSGKTSIMIVDDDKMTCTLIAKIFSKD